MEKPLNRFVFKMLLFIAPVLLFFEVLFRLGFAPIVTNSTLFDIKMLAVQKHHIKNVKLMAMGSSITLYELNSNIIVQNFNLPYYNFASWGLQIADMNRLLTDLVKTNKPKYVIVCSSLGDFTAPPNSSYLNYINTSNYIKDNFPEFFYFKNYNSIHQIIRRKFNTYPLVLDNWGGASLSGKLRNKNTGKGDGHDVFPTKYTQDNYQALDSLSAFLSEQKIEFIFVQAPVKKSDTGTDQYQNQLSAHFNKCKSIIEGNGGIYLNYYNTSIFTDSLFTDQYHLQTAGSVIFTKEIVADLKGVIK